jgi:hypothetical protein
MKKNEEVTTTYGIIGTVKNEAVAVKNGLVQVFYSSAFHLTMRYDEEKGIVTEYLSVPGDKIMISTLLLDWYGASRVSPKGEDR